MIKIKKNKTKWILVVILINIFTFVNINANEGETNIDKAINNIVTNIGKEDFNDYYFGYENVFDSKYVKTNLNFITKEVKLSNNTKNQEKIAKIEEILIIISNAFDEQNEEKILEETKKINEIYKDIYKVKIEEEKKKIIENEKRIKNELKYSYLYKQEDVLKIKEYEKIINEKLEIKEGDIELLENYMEINESIDYFLNKTLKKDSLYSQEILKIYLLHLQSEYFSLYGYKDIELIKSQVAIENGGNIDTFISDINNIVLSQKIEKPFFYNDFKIKIQNKLEILILKYKKQYKDAKTVEKYKKKFKTPLKVAKGISINREEYTIVSYMNFAKVYSRVIKNLNENMYTSDAIIEDYDELNETIKKLIQKKDLDIYFKYYKIINKAYRKNITFKYNFKEYILKMQTLEEEINNNTQEEVKLEESKELIIQVGIYVDELFEKNSKLNVSTAKKNIEKLIRNFESNYGEIIPAKEKIKENNIIDIIKKIIMFILNVLILILAVLIFRIMIKEINKKLK